MRKRCNRKRQFTPQYDIVRKTIVCANMEDLNEADQRDICLPAFLALDELLMGKLTSELFVTLNEFNCMTWAMGRQVAINRASEETGEIALMAKEKAEKAAEALATIGERWAGIHRFVTSGDEIIAIRQSFNFGRQLLGVVPTGMVMRAMIDAEKMVRDSLRKTRKSI